jgi:hypothetical protein
MTHFQEGASQFTVKLKFVLADGVAASELLTV